jgi:hypothetical protein
MSVKVLGGLRKADRKVHFHFVQFPLKSAELPLLSLAFYFSLRFPIAKGQMPYFLITKRVRARTVRGLLISFKSQLFLKNGVSPDESRRNESLIAKKSSRLFGQLGAVCLPADAESAAGKHGVGGLGLA